MKFTPQGLVGEFERYAVVHDPAEPSLFMGALWFLVLLGVTLAGPGYAALLFTGVGVVASLQVSGAWRSRRVAVNQPVAAIGTGLIIMASWLGNRPAAIAILLFVAASVLLGGDFSISPGALQADAVKANLTSAAATLRSGLFFGLAGAAVVQVGHVDSMALLFLVTAVSVYDAGDFLCSAGYSSRVVGPIAGMIGVLIVTMSMAALNPPPATSDSQVWALGLMLVVACPAGQLIGSWILPSSRVAAPGLRRLDAWLVAAPLFCCGIWLISGT